MKIKELTLLTNNLTGTKNFYSAKLCLDVLEERTDFISFRAGATVLIFRLSAIDSPVYHIAFNIPDNKIAEALMWCEKKKLHLLNNSPSTSIIDFPNWNAKSIYFLDSNGNVLEFIARYDLRNGTREAFCEHQLLSISEIGMVVDDVFWFAKTTNARFDIPYYEKQKPAPNFTVMGDTEGLMIVVPEKRKWFPTSIISKKFPVELIFEQGGKEFVFNSKP